MAQRDDMETMLAGVAAAEARLSAAVAARRAHETAQSGGRVKLSVKGWRDGLLALAGHDEARVRELDARMGSASHLFGNAVSYRHQVARHIADGFWWAPGPGTPTTAADKGLAAAEVQQIPGANLFTLALLSLTDAERMNPRAFGEHGDLDRHHRQRAAQTAHAETTLAAVAAIPDKLLRGMASARGLDVEPVGSLAQRLIAHELAGRPPRAAAKAQVADGGAILV